MLIFFLDKMLLPGNKNWFCFKCKIEEKVMRNEGVEICCKKLQYT
jgi:hypothetical protein